MWMSRDSFCGLIIRENPEGGVRTQLLPLELDLLGPFNNQLGRFRSVWSGYSGTTSKYMVKVEQEMRLMAEHPKLVVREAIPIHLPTQDEGHATAHIPPRNFLPLWFLNYASRHDIRDVASYEGSKSLTKLGSRLAEVAADVGLNLDRASLQPFSKLTSSEFEIPRQPVQPSYDGHSHSQTTDSEVDTIMSAASRQSVGLIPVDGETSLSLRSILRRVTHIPKPPRIVDGAPACALFNDCWEERAPGMGLYCQHHGAAIIDFAASRKRHSPRTRQSHSAS
jgi:hypothetical protein